jgi:hypothetical protein
MDRQDNPKDQPASADEAGSDPFFPEVAPKMALAALPKIELPRIELSKVELLKVELTTIEASPAAAAEFGRSATGQPIIDMTAAEACTIDHPSELRLESPFNSPYALRRSADPRAQAARIPAPKVEVSANEAPHIAPDIDDARASDDQAAPEGDAHEPTPPPAAGRTPLVSRFTVLAALLALSAAFGGTVGALVATSLARPGGAPVAVAGRTGIEEFHALKENVVQARVELAAIKAGIDASNRNASAQLTRIAERIDRIERQQADPAARLSKAVEAIERISRTDGSTAARDVTGSVPPLPVSGPPKPLGSVDGWILRDVRRGTALIEGRMGIIEVDQGDVVPGLGRIDAIRKNPDGRWVVVTTRGVITATH